MNLAAIREKRAAKVADMRALLSKSEAEKRSSLTDAEKATFDTLKGEFQALEGDEQRAAFMQEVERRQAGEPVGDKAAGELENRVSLLRVLQAGMEGRALTGAEAEYHRETERRTGRKAQGVFVPASMFERRANTTTSAADLVPTMHRADQYITPFRDALLARQLGVRVLTGLSGNLSIPKHGDGLTAGWVAEGGAVPEGNMTFDSVTMTPKHVGGFTEMSRQLIQQSSPDIEQLVRDDLAYLVARHIDAALIEGGGTNEPKGVLSTVGIQTASLAVLTWPNVLAMLQKLDLVNATAANIVASTKVKAQLAGTLKEVGIAGYLMEGGRMADLPVHFTKQLAEKAGTPSTGRLIAGDWSQVMLGVWSELDILVNPFAEAPYKRGGVLVRAMATCDVAVRHPEAFVVADDLAI